MFGAGLPTPPKRPTGGLQARDVAVPNHAVEFRIVGEFPHLVRMEPVSGCAHHGTGIETRCKLVTRDCPANQYLQFEQ